MKEGFSSSSEFGSDDEESKEKKWRGVGRHAVGFHGAIEGIGSQKEIASPKIEGLLKPINLEAAQPERHAAETQLDKVSRPAFDEHAGVEREHNLRQPTPEELAGLAAREARAEMYAHQLKELHTEKSEEDEDDEEDEAKKKVVYAAQKPVSPKPQHHEETHGKEAADPVDLTSSPPAGVEKELAAEARAEADPVSEESEDIMARAMSAEFAASTSGGELSNEAVPDVPVAAQAAQAPALESFTSSAVQPNAQERPSDDQAFRNIIENAFGARPGGASWHESEPGEPPISDTGEGADFPPPPSRPTAEGGAWDNPGWPRPNGMRMPSGAAMDALTLGGMAALASRERFRDLRHSMTEAALFGGELLLAAGLVGEHFARKHEARKLRRRQQQQAAALSQTNQALQQEQRAHQATRSKLENLHASVTTQTTTAEQVRSPAAASQAGERASTPFTHAAEAGLLGAVAAEEVVSRTGDMTETRRNLDHRELEQQLRSSREFGKAIKENPELRAAAEAAGVPVAELNRASVGESREPAPAAAIGAEGLNRERNFEQLQDPLAAKSKQAIKTSGGANDIAQGVLAAQSSISKNDSNDDWPAIKLDELPKDKTKRRSRLANPWVYVVVFIILVLILAAVYVVKSVAANFA